MPQTYRWLGDTRLQGVLGQVNVGFLRWGWPGSPPGCPPHTLLPLCSPRDHEQQQLQPWEPPSGQGVLLCLPGQALVLGLVLNGLALWVLCWRLPRWTETRIYMANLAVADLCLLCACPSSCTPGDLEDAALPAPRPCTCSLGTQASA